VIVVTGNGLKDLKNVFCGSSEVRILPPDRDAIEEALK
jgi:hypothetical protein